MRAGTLRAPILPILSEFAEGMAWDNPAYWPMLTPNEGRSTSVARLVPDQAAAQAAGMAGQKEGAAPKGRPVSRRESASQKKVSPPTVLITVQPVLILMSLLAAVPTLMPLPTCSIHSTSSM